MRQTLCPRCDNILDKNGHCSLCDYQVKVLCHHCGHYNIPKAKYCGGCGIGTTLSVRYRRKLNNLLSPFQQIKVKRFFAGIAFGTLLTLFAFSSMGMKYNVSDTDNETISETNDFIPIYDENIQNSALLKSVSSDIENYCLEKDINQKATFSDLNIILNILIKNLNHIAKTINKNKFPFDEAKSYFEKEPSIKADENLTRGSSALVIFAYISDLFELKYKDYTKGSNYKDIPRFNIMEVPATALSKHNIKLSASED